MHEQVRAAFRGDETKTLLVVEPLDGTALTLRHFLISFDAKIDDSLFRMKEYWGWVAGK
ncbi:hypothetical protein D3C75_1309070 [compost metagenome]